MPHPPVPPSDSRRATKRKNPGQSVNQLQTWQVFARDVPMYFRKTPPLDSQSFVYVAVVMLWPEEGKASLMDVRMSGVRENPGRFFAYFTGDCAGFFRDVKKSDQLCLYLSDAILQPVEEQSKQNTLNLPFTLTWDKKCRLNYVEKGMVDRPVTFPTPAAQDKAKQRIVARKTVTYSIPEVKLQEAGSALPYDTSDTPTKFGSLPGDRYPTPQPEETRQSHRAKKRKSQQEGQEVAEPQRPPAPPPVNADPASESGDAKAVPSKVSDSGSNPAEKEIIDLTIKEESRSATPISPAQGHELDSGPAGLQAGWGSFLPLDNIACSTDIKKQCSTVGVVTNARDVTETRTGDLSQRVNLSDPSYPTLDNPAANLMGHGITMFTKRYREWLPSPKYGDILILTGIKRTKSHQFGDYSSVIFWDKLKWAIYDPVTGSVTHGEPGDAPRESGADDVRGGMINPFYEPSPGDLLYCKRLSEWWKTVEKKRAEEGNAGARRSSVMTRKATQRMHRLISETDHESEPGGYFDCTVQVLNGFKNDNGVYSLYVTDFTKNQALGHNDKWPKGRSGTVLKIEMWDSAAARGPNLKNRGYYRLENCRMLHQDHYLQAKLVEPKIREFSKEEESDLADPRFAQLLKREAEFEKGSNVPLALENAPDESFFNCIVELLDRTSEGSDVFLHVTDYTPVPELFKSTFSQGPKFENLRGYVVKVRVRGSLAERASSMPLVNSYYLLEKMRFWQTGGTWACDMKDNHGRIEKLNPANAESNGMGDVKRRKKELGSFGTESEVTSRARSLATDPRGRPIEGTIRTPASGSSKVSVLPSKEELPTCFEIKARILDFYPITLDEDDCLLRVCGDCKNLVAETAESCLSCSSLTYQAPVVFRFSLLFMLGTENGEEFVVAAGNIDNGFTSEINGQDEDDALHKLKTLLRSLVGNLFEIHEHWVRQEEVDLKPDAPLVNFTLNAWGEERGEKETVVRYAVQDIKTL